MVHRGEEQWQKTFIDTFKYINLFSDMFIRKQIDEFESIYGGNGFCERKVKGEMFVIKRNHCVVYKLSQTKNIESMVYFVKIVKIYCYFTVQKNHLSTKALFSNYTNFSMLQLIVWAKL